MSDFKWTVDELLARYELEPDLLDVFVEGRFDQEVLSQHRSGGCAGPVFVNIVVRFFKRFSVFFPSLVSLAPVQG